MFRRKSYTFAIHVLFIFILLFQATSPALAAGQNKHDPTLTPTPTAQASNTPTPNGCTYYPIALSAQTLAGVNIGDTIQDIYNGSQPGNFGWLTWSGDQSATALATSLTPPGNSSTTYTNPANIFDHTLSTGDWVNGKAGVSNSSSVRQALDQLETLDIDLPVWDTATGNGANTQYHIVSFARVRITSYQLPGQNRISARFLGYSCGSGTPTVTPTLMATHASTSTQTPTVTTTFTSTSTPTTNLTSTKTLTLTASATPTLLPTNTFTATATDLPTPSETPTLTDTATVTVTTTPTDTLTLTPSSSPSATVTMTDTATLTATNTPTLTPTDTATPTSTETLTPTTTNSPSPTLTRTSTPTSTLPAGISCADLQTGLNGWLQSPWTSAGMELRQDSNGVYGYSAETGTYQVGMYIQMPAGAPYKVLLGGQHLTGVTVAQGTIAPGNTTPLTQAITPNLDGSYTVTAAYLELRWTGSGPTDLTHALVLTSFCHVAVTLTATSTATLTPLQANFTTATNPGIVGEALAFTGISTNIDHQITSWLWDFGDGQNSTLQNPSHIYTLSGAFPAKLTIQDQFGNSASFSQTVDVTYRPVAGFLILQAPLFIDTPTQLLETSHDPDGSIVTWHWDFGDGATSDVPNAAHTYSAIGTYNITLTVTDDKGAQGQVSAALPVILNQPANATGTLFYTINTGGSNEKKVTYQYDGSTFTLGTPQDVATTGGADGIIFAPDGDLLIGGANTQQVFKINPATGHALAVRVTTKSYHLALDPDGKRAWTADLNAPGGNLIEIPLVPFFADGIDHPIHGDDTRISSIAFDRNGQAYYTADESLGHGNGTFGLIDLTTFTTHRILVDPLHPLQANVPAAHSMVFDDFTGNLMLFGSNHVTQIDPVTLQIVSDLIVPNMEFDQGTTDGRGHIFVASYNGYLLFVDFTTTRKVSDPETITSVTYLSGGLDDVAPHSGLGSSKPTAFSQRFSTAINQPHSMTLAGSDPGGSPLSYIVISLPTHGTLNGTLPNMTYQPDPAYSGPDQLSFKVTNGSNDSDPVTVDIAVGIPLLPTPTPTINPYKLDFETGDLSGWTVVSGDAFGPSHVVSLKQSVNGEYFYQQGNYHLWGYQGNGDGPVGELHSDTLTLPATNCLVGLLVSGGNANDIANVYVALTRASDGVELFKATGPNSESYHRVVWDACAYVGTDVYVKVVDNNPGGWGHINLDDVEFVAKETTPTPTPTPTTPACQTWDLARDFRTAPNQENPNRDSCGNLGVWSFMQSANLALNPQTYTLMSNFDPNAVGITGFNYWHANEGVVPYIGLNATANPLTFGAATFQPGTIGVHPGPNNLAVIAWRSPVSGYISITGGVSDNDPGAGDGIQWFLDRNASGAVAGSPLQRLASGSYANGGAQTFSQGSGGAHLNSVAVNIGDVIYLAIDPSQNYFNDFTRVDFLINLVPAPTPTPLVTPTALPINYALRFNPGATSHDVLYVPATNLNFGLDMTIEFWVRTTSNTGGDKWYHSSEWILDKDLSGEGNPDWAVVVHQGRIGFDNGNPNNPNGGGDQPLYSTQINDGIWHHIAIVRNVSTGNGMTVIYVDGVQNVSGVFPTGNLSNNLPLIIGGQGMGETNAFSFHGDLDDLRLWNIPRSQSDIQNDMITLVNGDETGLMGDWRLNEGSGQVAGDQTQFQINGQLGNSINADAGDPLWILASELYNATPTPIGPTPTPTKTATAAPTATTTPTATATQPQPLDIPGWIASPLEQSTISGVTPIKLVDSITLTDGTIDYWPVDDTSQLKVLAEHVSGNGGAILASLDATLLANDSYIIRLQGTSSTGEQKSSGVLVTVTGELKPGRVRFTITDFTVPLAGLPITIGRTYDSLERTRSGDFGYGWSLAIGNPRLTVSQAKDVTMTMPNGKRVTFYFSPAGNTFLFLHPHYTPEPGVYGSLDVADCPLIVSGGKYFCFLESGEYQPAQYTYTDPYGRKFVMSDHGTLTSITDLNGNTLTFSSDGITSNLGGLHIPFVRDTQGRITKITDPEGNDYNYGYDAAGDLTSFKMPGVSQLMTFMYDAHFFKSAVDPRGHTLITDTYYLDGRLKSEMDALGNTWQYAYDAATHTTTVINPDNGTEVSTYDEYGKLLKQTNPLGDETSFTYDNSHNMLTKTDALNHTTTYTYNSNGHTTSVKDALGRTVATVAYNQYGEPDVITDGLNHSYNVSYDDNYMPISLSDSLGSLGGYTWDSHGSPLTRSNGNGESITYTYDAFGNLLSQKDALNPPSTFTYDSLGRMLTKTDPLGHTTTYTYDELGHVLTSKDALLHTTRYSYDPNGNRTDIFDPLQRHTRYEYDDANHISKTTLPDGTFTTYTYDFRGHVLTMCAGGASTHSCNNTTRYTYDLAGQLLSATSADGLPEASTVRYEYDEVGRKVKSFDALGNPTLYAYDATNRLVEITDALNGKTINTYDVLGQLRSTKDELGHITSFDYDSRGRKILITYPDTTTTSNTYDGVGRLLSVVDQTGHITHHVYDLIGRMSAVTTAYGTSDAATTQYGYDAAGRRISETDALNHTTHYTFDEMDRLLSVCAGESQSHPCIQNNVSVYDAAGQLISSTDADQHTTGYIYDLLGHRTQTNYADGSTSKQAYDDLGRLSTKTDQNDKTTTYTYDGLGHLLSTINPMQQSTSYSYDAAGNLLAMTDANGHQTSFAYDTLHRQTRKTRPDLFYEETTYDALGNPLSERLVNPASPTATGNANTFIYDEMNRLRMASYFDPSARQVFNFSYTPSGLRDTVIDSRGQTSYSYDNQNRLIRITHPGDQQTIVYSYDANGNRSTLSTDAGATGYSYDELNRLVSVTGPENNTTTYSYDNQGLRTQKSLPNGVVTNYSYDDLNRLTQIVQNKGGATLNSYIYTLDPAGNRLSEQSTINNQSSVINYQYDDAYRLIAANSSTYQAAYTYDNTGNRLTQTINGTSTDYTYNNLDQMLTAGALQYRYDARGSMTKIINGPNVAQYSYDALNRQTDVSLPGSIAITNTYDADGRRVKQAVGSQETNYLWDETTKYGDVLLETNKTGDVTASYVLGETELLSQTRSGTTSYYLQDGQGSTRALANAAGDITDTYTYSAFGETLNHTGSTTNPYQYTGQQLDSATGLYDLRARYYDPSVGRFLSQDTYPVNFNNPIELNRYVYTADNPVNMFDPSGMQELFEFKINLSMDAKRAIGIAAIGLAVLYAFRAIVFLMPTVGTWTREIPVFGNPDTDIPWWRKPWFPNPDDANGSVPPETAAEKEIIDALIRAAEEALRRARPIPNPDPTTEPQPTTQPTVFPTIIPPIFPTATSEPQEVIVDLGSGLGLWPKILKEVLHPNDRVIATETGDNLVLLRAFLAGTGVEIHDGWDSLSSKMADETWAIAPNPTFGTYDVIRSEGKAGLRITKDGKVFHMVIKKGEIQDRNDLDDLLNSIDAGGNWNVVLTQMSTLGIPSTYIDPQDDVWYITDQK